MDRPAGLTVLTIVVRGIDAVDLEASGVEMEGAIGVLVGLLAVLDQPDPDFAIVTP